LNVERFLRFRVLLRVKTSFHLPPLHEPTCWRAEDWGEFYKELEVENSLNRIQRLSSRRALYLFLSYGVTWRSVSPSDLDRQ